MIDFGVLTGAAPSRQVLSTRAILANVSGGDGVSRLVGLVADDVSRVQTIKDGNGSGPGLRLGAAPYLGELIRLDEGLVQLVDVDRLPTAAAITLEGG